jgi:hypothetical protein
VTVTASAGTEPTFSWTPACTVRSLEVRDEPQGTTVWSMFGALFENTVNPPVPYSAGYGNSGGARTPLVAGRQYRVLLFAEQTVNCIPSLQNCEYQVGTATFTP